MLEDEPSEGLACWVPAQQFIHLKPSVRVASMEVISRDFYLEESRKLKVV
jgi:hypothetical protein